MTAQGLLNLKFLTITFVSLLACSCSGTRTITVPSASEPTSVALTWDGSVGSSQNSRTQPMVSTGGMVVADDSEAARWGTEILRRGGNAVDAAVATAFALAVTRPHFAALGGGGFLLYCPARALTCQAIDYRERAPGAATADMYLREGKVAPELSTTGPLAIGVPGTPAGLLLALEKFGKLPRQAVLSKPIVLARDGIRMSSYTEYAVASRWAGMNDAAKQVFGCARNGKIAPCPVGTLLRQQDLARVLERIAAKGRAGFYEGEVAAKISGGIRGAGGLITRDDLAGYQPTLRTPLTGSFGGMEVVTMPPPSAGGALLLQMLGYAERAERKGLLAEGPGSVTAMHALAHAMALGFADRVRYFGDPDQVTLPVGKLLAPEYLDGRWATFHADRAALPVGGGEIPKEPEHTTHLSVVDAEGNAVALTTTVNDNLGSAFVPPGTGIVMNDEMDDFSALPSVSPSNAIAPKKRPVSSMTPTILRDSDRQVRLVLGAAGGRRITTSVFQVLVNRLKFGMSLPDAMNAPRFHHEWKPESLRVERYGFPRQITGGLTDLGYKIQEVTSLARMHGLERFPNGRSWGVADRRGEGAVETTSPQE